MQNNITYLEDKIQQDSVDKRNCKKHWNIYTNDVKIGTEWTYLS